MKDKKYVVNVVILRRRY